MCIRDSYYLLTASVYESTYEGSNGRTFNTAFNGNYTCNFLTGKEWRLKRNTEKGKQSSFNLDLRLTWNGGQRYVPIDLEASRLADEAVFDFERSFAERYPDYFRLDVKAGFKRNGKKATHTIALDLQNVTNRQNVFTREFNAALGQLVDTYQLGFLPVLQYRVLF